MVLPGRIDGLVDDGHVLAVDGRSTGRVDGSLVNYGSGLLVSGEAARGVNCLVDADSLLVDGTASGSVNGGLRTVVRLELGAVFTLSDVDGVGVVGASGLELDGGVGVRVGVTRSEDGKVVSSEFSMTLWACVLLLFF